MKLISSGSKIIFKTEKIGKRKRQVLFLMQSLKSQHRLNKNLRALVIEKVQKVKEWDESVNAEITKITGEKDKKKNYKQFYDLKKKSE